MEIISAHPPDEAPPHLAWHKPILMKLIITVDTGNETGSFGDGEAYQEFPRKSDVRLKKDISPIEGALRGVLSLKGVEYVYDSAAHPELGLTKGPQLGFIAQDLEPVYPQLVHTKPHGFKAINYAQLVPVLVEAIKEQQSMIAELQEQVQDCSGPRRWAHSKQKQEHSHEPRAMPAAFSS